MTDTGGSDAARPPKARIAAVGAGRMGRGIAQIFAYAGHEVALIDVKPRPAAESARLLDEARAEVAGNLAFLAELGVLDRAQSESVLARISLHDEGAADAAMANADVLFEGVRELLEAKQPVLARMAAAAAPEAILASTTSTMSVDELAVFTGRPERFLNAHFLNPAYLIPLVEVSPGAATEPAVREAMLDLLRAAGKKPVLCAASPGFIVPRIQAVAMNEAARMVEEGVATPEDIDAAIRYGFGLRYATMGLVEFIDWGGGDILYYASKYLQGALGSDRYAAPEILERKMADGHTGMDAGQGFYDFAAMDVPAYRREKMALFVALLRHFDLLAPPA